MKSILLFITLIALSSCGDSTNIDFGPTYSFTCNYTAQSTLCYNFTLPENYYPKADEKTQCEEVGFTTSSGITYKGVFTENGTCPDTNKLTAGQCYIEMVNNGKAHLYYYTNTTGSSWSLNSAHNHCISLNPSSSSENLNYKYTWESN